MQLAGLGVDENADAPPLPSEADYSPDQRLQIPVRNHYAQVFTSDTSAEDPMADLERQRAEERSPPLGGLRREYGYHASERGANRELAKRGRDIGVTIVKEGITATPPGAVGEVLSASQGEDITGNKIGLVESIWVIVLAGAGKFADGISFGVKKIVGSSDEAAKSASEVAEGVAHAAPRAVKGITKVAEPSASSWRKHGARLYADLKNKFGLDVPFKRKDKNIRALVASEYQKLIDSGKLKYLGQQDDVHGKFHFYEHDGNLYLFGEGGELVSRWAPGSEGRAIRRVLDAFGISGD